MPTHLRAIKLTKRKFVERAVRALRKDGYPGIHVVYSGFNRAFRAYYGEEPKRHILALQAEGFLKVFPTRGGVVIVLASEYAGTDEGARRSDAEAVLRTILRGQ